MKRVKRNPSGARLLPGELAPGGSFLVKEHSFGSAGRLYLRLVSEHPDAGPYYIENRFMYFARFGTSKDGSSKAGSQKQKEAFLKADCTFENLFMIERAEIRNWNELCDLIEMSKKATQQAAAQLKRSKRVPSAVELERQATEKFLRWAGKVGYTVD